MSGPSVAHLINQLRADAYNPPVAPAVALAAADALERQAMLLRLWVPGDDSGHGSTSPNIDPDRSTK